MVLLHFTYQVLPKLKFSVDMRGASVLGQYALGLLRRSFFCTVSAQLR